MVHSILCGDNREVLRGYSENYFDAVVTDPPYGLDFMGKEWDRGVPGVAFWEGILRVAKPGSYLVAFGGTRSWHRLAVAIEDAGWEIRDTLAWLYGQGFPKSLDVSKALDAEAGVERPIVGTKTVTRILNPEDVRVFNYATGLKGRGGEIPVTGPATEAAKIWEGWGTALKPAFEPIILARKPLIGTVAKNILSHGTGALNIDGSRIGSEGGEGRWPANVLLDQEAAGILDGFEGASRFFYVAKATRSERTRGGSVHNPHPTVKPLALMRWLVKLVTPPKGKVLDPFCGSGSTILGAEAEGFEGIGIEIDPDSVRVAKERLKNPLLSLSVPEEKVLDEKGEEPPLSIEDLLGGGGS